MSATVPAADAWAEGQIHLIGRLTSASNATFLVDIEHADGSRQRCVHKPVAGEQPLWDFPDGTLAQREVGARLLSEAAGFHVVPPTLLVEGPLGPGMVQQWIESEGIDGWVSVDAPGQTPEGWYPVLDGIDADGNDVILAHAERPALRRIALFDAVVNNSDRKGSHLLPVGDHVWGVDHGVSLHTDDKLRTILWGWAGAELDAEERTLVAAARDRVGVLEEYVTGPEQDALVARCDRMLSEGSFPEPSENWPAVPWPPL